MLTNRTSTTPGGIPTILQVFETLAKYEDSKPEEKKRTAQERKMHYDLNFRVRKALLVLAVMFSEASRFRCIYLEMIERIENWAESSELETSLWNLINNWSHWSDKILDLWHQDPGFTNSMANSLDIDPAKPSQCVEVKFITSSSSSIRRRMETVSDLIGKNGQLTFMKRNQDKMISNSHLDTKRRKIGVDILDPCL